MWPLLVALLAPGGASPEPFGGELFALTVAASAGGSIRNEIGWADFPPPKTRVTQPAGSASAPRHPGVKDMGKDLVEAVKHLPSKENLLWTALGGGLALAVHPADDNVNEALVNSDFAHDFFRFGEPLGELYTLIPVSAAVYVIGRAKDRPEISHIGADLLESLALSEGLVQALKYTTRRERPDGSGKTSFPSGHAADTFAFATALERHLSWRWWVPAYIFSSYVAISRLPDNRHWLSDAVFGATVGVIAGRTVTRHGRAFPVTIAAVPGGAAILYVRRPQPLATPTLLAEGGEARAR